MEDMRFSFSGIFPGSNIRKFLIIALGFTVGSLEFFPEMGAARFSSFERIIYKKRGKLKIISNPAGLFKFRIQLMNCSGDLQIAPEFFLKVSY